jgi:hypothetical protein
MSSATMASTTPASERLISRAFSRLARKPTTVTESRLLVSSAGVSVFCSASVAAAVAVLALSCAADGAANNAEAMAADNTATMG